jgi:hypothetical protein
VNIVDFHLSFFWENINALPLSGGIVQLYYSSIMEMGFSGKILMRFFVPVSLKKKT